MLELINGKCDVVVIDSATANKYVGDNKGLKIVEDKATFGSEYYGIAVKSMSGPQNIRISDERKIAPVQDMKPCTGAFLLYRKVCTIYREKGTCLREGTD